MKSNSKRRSAPITSSNGNVKRMRKAQMRKKHLTFVTTLLGVFILTSILVIIFKNFNTTHFAKGTTINGIDCSWLTVEDAYEKLNKSFNEKVITFMLVDDSYSFTGDCIDLKVTSEEHLQEFLINQNTDKQLDFALPSFSFNSEKLSEIMKSLPNFDDEHMVHPEDAYITQSEDGFLSIKPEIVGNYLHFDTAYAYAKNELEHGFSTICFYLSTSTQPKITTENLQPAVDEINNVLKTSITLKINDETSFTLDNSIMKNWLVVDDLGNYSIDIDSNLPVFLDEVAEKCAHSTVTFEFNATDFGTVTVPTKNSSFDKDAEIELIKSELGTAMSYIRTPNYKLHVGGNYVEVDLSRQHVWLYKDDVCIMDTDCVTGNKGNHDTREGFFYLSSKEKDRILRGYNDNGTKYSSHVDFWMPFDGGIGLHDAAWRRAFGGNIYLTNGSLGSVNLPRSAAETIYNNIDYSTPIIVYYSDK